MTVLSALSDCLRHYCGALIQNDPDQSTVRKGDEILILRKERQLSIGPVE
jgi:hypothetical protein